VFVVAVILTMPCFLTKNNAASSEKPGYKKITILKTSLNNNRLKISIPEILAMSRRCVPSIYLLFIY
jgi:hypothetical protein